MSFVNHAARFVAGLFGAKGEYDKLGSSVGIEPKPPVPPPPGVPGLNDAANAARTQTDLMRQRRGLLANIFAGASSQQPVTGKTQLGT